MTRGPESRGWIAVIAATAAVTAVCSAGYLFAPFDPPPAKRADTAAPGVVPADDRVVAFRRDGQLVLLDARDGTVSEIVRPADLDEPRPNTLALGLDGQTAYLSAGEDGQEIRYVRLRSGEEEVVTPGSSPALGRRQQLTVPIDEQGPSPELLAFVDRRGPDGDVIVIENNVTGERSRIEAGAIDTNLVHVDDLEFSPFENRLYGIADGGRALFRVTTDEGLPAPEGDVLTPDPALGVQAWIDLTFLGDRLLCLARFDDGSTGFVEVATDPFEATGVLAPPPELSATMVAIDADPSARQVLIVSDDDTLWRWSGQPQTPPFSLADDIEVAAW